MPKFGGKRHLEEERAKLLVQWGFPGAVFSLDCQLVFVPL